MPRRSTCFMGGRLTSGHEGRTASAITCISYASTRATGAFAGRPETPRRPRAAEAAWIAWFFCGKSSKASRTGREQVVDRTHEAVERLGDRAWTGHLGG